MPSCGSAHDPRGDRQQSSGRPSSPRRRRHAGSRRGGTPGRRTGRRRAAGRATSTAAGGGGAACPRAAPGSPRAAPTTEWPPWPAYTAEDSTGEWLDGGRSYTLALPSGIPVKNFWAVNAYDPQPRSLLRTEHPYPSVNSQSEGVRHESNGDTVVHFGPTAPEGQKANWVQTVPGKGFFVMLRLYGPLESWFDKSWRPGEIEPA
ncbi:MULTISPECIES: DUF1214 domain-containing protein [unclassified Streptomyces]|uniref:DUF1214 domain-containing protein n=1 Tax=unclassified Streptomyces TaxID=2593676 RepID=UPI00210C06FA|nr:DUF1214 domain-containing protein [Streptomyces sp. AVP053U2]